MCLIEMNKPFKLNSVNRIYKINASTKLLVAISLSYLLATLAL